MKSGLLILFLVAVVVFSGCIGCPPADWKGPWPPWCDKSQVSKPSDPISAQEGAVGVQQDVVGAKQAEPYVLDIFVEVPKNTPAHSVIFFEVLNDRGEVLHSFEMQKVGETGWHLRKSFAEFKETEIYYRYSRGNWGFVGAEEFSPDSKTAHRKATIEKEQKEIHDNIKKWRWFPAVGQEIMQSIPTKAGSVSFVPRINSEHYQKGVLIVDFWWNNFEALLDSTHARLKSNGFEWIEIAPPWDYKQVNPGPIITNVGVGHAYTDEKLDLHLGKIKGAGFKAFVSAQICCANIDNAAFTPEWWSAWFEQYEKYALYFADMAEKHSIDALVLSGDGVALDKKPQGYLEKLNAIYSKVRQHYHGKLGRHLFLGGTIDNIHELLPKPQEIPLAEEWDFFAVNFWTGISNTNNPTQEELYSNVKKIFDLRLKPLYELYKKPIVLQQIAYSSIDGGLKGNAAVDDPNTALWEPYSDKFSLDLEEQAMGYETIMKNVAETNYIVGTFPFTYWPDDFPLTKEYNTRGKPAEETISKWYKSTG